jgi:hypothetical protein
MNLRRKIVLITNFLIGAQSLQASFESARTLATHQLSKIKDMATRRHRSYEDQNKVDVSWVSDESIRIDCSIEVGPPNERSR